MNTDLHNKQRKDVLLLLLLQPIFNDEQIQNGWAHLLFFSGLYSTAPTICPLSQIPTIVPPSHCQRQFLCSQHSTDTEAVHLAQAA